MFKLTVITYNAAFFIIFLTTALLSNSRVVAASKASDILSPDGKMKATFQLTSDGQLMYRLDYENSPILAWSTLGLETEEREMARQLSITSEHKVEHRETFNWPLGESNRITNNYNELVLDCSSIDTHFQIDVRLFNGSLAFRYKCKNPEGKTIKLKKELTEFSLGDSYIIYQYHEESIFTPIKVDSLKGLSDLPSTLVYDQKKFISIGEADNRNYSKCVLVKDSKKNSLCLDFYTDTAYKNHIPVSIVHDGPLIYRDSLVTPWRTVSFSSTAIGLHQFSDLPLKLVTPINKTLPTGIKPGKVFRVQINTQGALKGVDFASKMNFQYIMLDAGWYGAEFRTVSNPLNPIATVDLKKIIEYATSKNIGVILYVNYVGLRAKLDSILPLYKKWGVSGLKFGFVDGGTQQGLRWLDSAMNKVNQYGLVLNVHDHYKPTGLSRRYPYNLSQEGIRGDENSPDAFHTMVLPFTRYIAGAADFTFCYPSKTNNFSKNLKVSKGQQLALTVVYFDPLQSIFWYGKPEDYDANDTDLEFFKYVPTVWDESKYLDGKIGESICVARRKGDTWYLGNAAGYHPFHSNLNLDFLRKDQTYIATIYEDDGHGKIRKRTRTVKSEDKLSVAIDAKCGQAIIIRPSH